MDWIMIIDDDATSLAIGRAFLEGEFKLSFVHSGMQALGALQSENLPDLILLDVLMPGISGLEVMEKISNDDRLKEIPVIFLTGEKSVDVEIAGFTNGASDFIQKPVNKFLLKTKIYRQLERIELKRENLELKKQLELLKAEK